MSSPPYQLSVDGFPEDHFRVHSFSGKETLSEAYVFDVVVTAPLHGDDEIERTALGQRATLIWNVGKGPRAFYGVLAAVRLEGVQGADDFLKLRMRLVPRLWLLKRKKRTRIFQNMRVPDVVTAVLLEAGIASKWQLLRAHPVREYCTQYEESDYRFVTRLLAEAAIFFYFPEGPPVDAAALAAASIAGAVGAMADSVVSAVAGSAAGALAGSLASAAAPLIPGDTVVCGDDASWYPSIGGDDAAELAAADAASLLPEVGAAFGDLGDAGGAALGAVSAVAGAVIAAATASSAPPLYYLAMQHTANSHRDKVTRFSAQNSVRANVATYREYDPLRPMVQLTSAAASTAPFPPSPAEIAAGAAYAAGAMAAGVASLAGAAGSVLGGIAGAVSAVDSLIGQLSPAANLEAYEHHGPFLFPKWASALDEAPRILRQKRRRASVAEGESGCPDLAPGHRFALQDHPADHLDRPYVVTSVEHHGDTQPQSGERQSVYRNAFECAPAEVTYVPPRPSRKRVQVSLTATVVGPAGEEIYVDALGQIKVQFHWDRAGTFDEGSSCWIRTMQPWGGAGWGVQFIPRVGMEVVILFEGGDADKPMVLGSLYNGTHPSPFALPGDRTRSGWRTQSSPGGGGFNELSFEDAATQEQIYVHAQRDLDEAVERDHTRRVGEDERIAVARDRALTVGGDQHLVTRQARRELVGTDSHLHVKGDLRQKVDQKMSLVAHDLHIKIEAKHALEAADEIHIKAGKTLVIEVGEDLTIKGPGGFIRIDAGGVTIKGTLVKINSGGSAGSAGDASPDAPDEAKEAQVAGVEAAPTGAADAPSPTPQLPSSGGGAGAPPQ